MNQTTAARESIALRPRRGPLRSGARCGTAAAAHQRPRRQRRHVGRCRGPARDRRPDDRVRRPGDGTVSDAGLAAAGGRDGAPAAQLLDELGYEDVDVAGYSLGGVVAAAPRALVSRPREEDRADLDGGRRQHAQRVRYVAAMPQRYYSRTLYEQTKAFLSPVDREVVDWVVNLRDARFRHPPTKPAISGSCGAPCGRARVQRRRTRARRPRDRGRPGSAANAVQLARPLPNSRLQIVPGRGHLLIYDPRAAAVSLLEDFFGTHRLDRSRAWSTGVEVDDDATVEAAFAASAGDATLAALSRAYRRRPPRRPERERASAGAGRGACGARAFRLLTRSRS